jgi:hypothetical protein
MSPDLILNGHLLNDSLILCAIYETKVYRGSASHVPYRSGHQTHPNHSELCLPVASAEPLPGH